MSDDVVGVGLIGGAITPKCRQDSSAPSRVVCVIMSHVTVRPAAVAVVAAAVRAVLWCKWCHCVPYDGVMCRDKRGVLCI